MQVLMWARLWCVFHKCSETPLCVFIALDDNPKALRRRLFPSKQTLEMARVMLGIEFAKLCDEKADLFPAKQALKLRLQVTQLEQLLDIHAKSSSRHRAEIERKMSEFTGSTSVAAAKEKLGELMRLLDMEEKKLEKDKKRPAFRFEDLVVDITKYLGFQIDRKNTTVAEFAGYIKSSKIQLKTTKKSTGLK